MRAWISQLLCLILILLIANTAVLAQPGGGGGLTIGNLYNTRQEKIDLLNDAALQIRTFILKDDKIYQETFLYDAFLEKNGQLRISRQHYGFGFPPADDVNEDGYADRESNQRMLIMYDKDTMIIDFTGIIGGNAGGYTDKMDSLVIQKGYFKYYRTKKKNTEYHFPQDEITRKCLNNGLTPYTAQQLAAGDYMAYDPVTDLSFLQDDRLPASYYFKRAAFYLKNKHTAAALADIETGIRRNNGIASCEALYLLVEVYTATGQYEKAIDNITLAMDCKRFSWNESWENKVQNYQTRIDLLTRLGKYDKALEDYNTIVSISKDITGAVIERAEYKTRYLGDYAGAKNDLVTLVNAIPADHLGDHPQGASEFADVYFVLAGVEYAMGDIYAASKHWLKAEEFGYSTSSSNGPVLHFDAVIRQHPNIPELYLCRALAAFKRAPFLGWGKETELCFEQALDDIYKAERTGMNDHRINMYRARVLTLLKRYDEAMKEINIAIAKNNTDPRCYLFRYEIRNNLGQTKWGNNNDADYQRYLQLCKQWRWERF